MLTPGTWLNSFSISTCRECMDRAFGISTGQISSHCPQLTQESEIVGAQKKLFA
jgi:hypothetical protein